MDLFEWCGAPSEGDKAVQLSLKQVRLHSYVVARDYGFAPNPFFGCCTLATCKPVLRRIAQVGDWIVGTGSARKGKDVRLVFAMQVGEDLTFDEYWADQRFRRKRPNLSGSKKQAFGDNIYHLDPKTGEWLQENSHHSLKDGSRNLANVANDTQTDRVLVSDWYVYFGGNGPVIPARFRDFDGIDIYAGRGMKNSQIPKEMAEALLEWIKSLSASGFVQAPLEWRPHTESFPS